LKDYNINTITIKVSSIMCANRTVHQCG